MRPSATTATSGITPGRAATPTATKHHKRHGYKHIAHRNHYSRRHHGHDHRYGAPCNVETHERVRRNRHGEVVEYERHERRGHDRYARR
jgi:hypothetical protein